MADETPKTFTFEFVKDEETDSFLAQAELIGAVYQGEVEVPLPEMDKDRKAFAINEVAYGRMVMNALANPLAFMRVPTNPLTRRQKAMRFLRRTRLSFYQRIHDWSEKKGAYCRDY